MAGLQNSFYRRVDERAGDWITSSRLCPLDPVATANAEEAKVTRKHVVFAIRLKQQTPITLFLLLLLTLSRMMGCSSAPVPTPIAPSQVPGSMLTTATPATIPAGYELYTNEQMGVVMAKPKGWAIRESEDRLGVDFYARQPQRGIISALRMDEGRDFDAESIMSVALYAFLQDASVSGTSYVETTQNINIAGYPGAKVMVSCKSEQLGEIDILVIGTVTPITAYMFRFILPSEDRALTNKLYSEMIATVQFISIQGAFPTAGPTTPTSTPTAVQAGIPEGFQIYRNEAWGVELVIPKDWQVVVRDTAVGFVPSGPSDIGGVIMVMIGRYAASGLPAEELANIGIHGWGAFAPPMLSS